MSDKKKKSAVITGISMIEDGIYSMWIKEEESARNAGAGQFVSLFCSDDSRMLPRPISICEIERESGLLRLVFRVTGKGTEEFSQKNAGDRIEIMGPLGNGFKLEGKRTLLMGGGIGIPPMLELARELTGQGVEELTVILGYRDSLFLKRDFEPFGNVIVTTEDGSSGIKGNVMDAVRQTDFQADMIYACGPLPMLKGIKRYAEEAGIRAQISVEERMACGIGACLACVCGSNETDSHTNVNNKRICKDGPVFYASEIIL